MTDDPTPDVDELRDRLVAHFGDPAPMTADLRRALLERVARGPAPTPNTDTEDS